MDSQAAVARLLGASLLLAMVAVALFADSADATNPGQSPFRHDLSRVDSHLRFAVELGPEALGEGLQASEVVCRLATTTEERAEADRAAAEWVTLGQLVEQTDRPAAAIDGAFGQASSMLLDLRRAFSAAWLGERRRVAALRRGTTQARRGIAKMRAGMRRLETAVPAWSERDCGVAAREIQLSRGGIVPGLNLLNAGMQSLWPLAEPALRPAKR